MMDDQSHLISVFHARRNSDGSRVVSLHKKGDMLEAAMPAAL